MRTGSSKIGLIARLWARRQSHRITNPAYLPNRVRRLKILQSGPKQRHCGKHTSSAILRVACHASDFKTPVASRSAASRSSQKSRSKEKTPFFPAR